MCLYLVVLRVLPPNYGVLRVVQYRYKYSATGRHRLWNLQMALRYTRSRMNFTYVENMMNSNKSRAPIVLPTDLKSDISAARRVSEQHLFEVPRSFCTTIVVEETFYFTDVCSASDRYVSYRSVSPGSKTVRYLLLFA